MPDESVFILILYHEAHVVQSTGGFLIPKNVQSGEHSKDSAIDGTLHELASSVQPAERRLPQLERQPLVPELELA